MTPWIQELTLNPFQETRLPEEPRRPVTPKLRRNLSFDNGSKSKLVQPKEQVNLILSSLVYCKNSKLQFLSRFLYSQENQSDIKKHKNFSRFKTNFRKFPINLVVYDTKIIKPKALKVAQPAKRSLIL